MINEFKCINEECKDYNVVKEYSHKMNETPICESCNKGSLLRVWNYAGGIKTSDGYKS